MKLKKLKSNESSRLLPGSEELNADALNIQGMSCPLANAIHTQRE